jgi:iron complex transport system ATP-binding protein
MQCDSNLLDELGIFDFKEGPEVTLNVLGVCFGYGKAENTLKGIDIEAKRGEFIGLLGPNGSGKTTLMRCINKVLSTHEGSINLLDKDVKSLTISEISKICTTVPADVPTEFALSVKEFVALGRSPHVVNLWWEKQEDLDIIERAMWTFGISQYSKRRLSELSSGERARVLLAKGVVQEPQVMLVDEPSAHLDIKYKVQVMEMLRDLSRKGITVLMASHDVNLVTRYCDKVLLLGRGKILDYGLPKEVVTESAMKEIFDVDVKIVNVDNYVYILPMSPPDNKGV